MKRVTILFFLSTFLIIISCGEKKEETNNTSEVKEQKDSIAKVEVQTPLPDSATMMKLWMEFMTPGDMHTLLTSQNGTYNEEVTLWYGPDSPSTTSTAKAENTMILGGRYQQTKHTGDFNGMPFEGLSTIGYDNMRKIFVITWIDNLGTGILYMEGDYDVATKTINSSGTMSDPTTGKIINIREVFTFIDENSYTMSMYTTPPAGKEFKNMEAKYTRKK